MNLKNLVSQNLSLTLLITSLFSLTTYTQEQSITTNNTEKHIVVIVASYNNKDWYKKHMDSFTNQDYQNKTMIYVDDCSPDNTGNLIEQYITEKNIQDQVILIKNDIRLGSPLANQYKAIELCEETDIIVILDGDDHLAHNQVLSRVNEIYQDPNVWLTYGQFKHASNGRRGFCTPMPAHVIKNNSFRTHRHIPSHLRTFYAGLFKKIKLEDIMYQGKIFQMTGDIAAMFPMIEMASKGHFKFVPEVLLVYNDMTAFNEHKISKTLQRKLDLVIRSRQKYTPLENLFTN